MANLCDNPKCVNHATVCDNSVRRRKRFCGEGKCHEIERYLYIDVERESFFLCSWCHNAVQFAEHGEI